MELRTNLWELIGEGSQPYDIDNSDNESYTLDASVDIEKELGDVDSVKYKSYHFALTQIDNKMKELQERIASL